ncbi:hypothetical protein [Acidovorax sp. CCYZU-2555]|uniref:hypothetical protein n=1 Tax=Acidovorax sp. CCYZU-2555 TaxID=2835042 RepID=UPI001BCADE79|nr:hypothetical protein [Acidovorax sp. CCYZU-2555]MBS7776412.1 hypothetical protein [Acidovorax sp. CCYZU-2555]
MNLAGLDQTIAGSNNAGAVQLSAPSATPASVLTVTGLGQGGELAMATNDHAGDRLRLSGAAAVASANTTMRMWACGATCTSA